MSGTVDFSNEIPPKDWAMCPATPGIVGQTLEGLALLLAADEQHETPPMDNPKVRQAIAHAINRQAIVAGTFFGQATPILGGVIPEWNWAYAGLEVFKPEGDVEKAKALLAEAGVPDGFETSITMASSFPAMVAMAPIIQANLAAVGIKADDQDDGDPALLGRGLGPEQLRHHDDVLGKPARRSRRLRLSTTTPAAWRSTCRRAAAEAMDAVLDEAKSGTTQEARKAAYRKQQELSLEEMPIVPLVNAWILIAHTDKLKNYKPMRTGFLKTLKDAWLESLMYGTSRPGDRPPARAFQAICRQGPSRSCSRLFSRAWPPFC